MIGRVDIAALRALMAKASPGPWYVAHHDDTYCMNAFSVRTDRQEMDFGETSPSEDESQYGGCVAITLLQEPRYACHLDGRYEENAHLIAAMRNNLGPLLDEIEELRVSRPKDSPEGGGSGEVKS